MVLGLLLNPGGLAGALGIPYLGPGIVAFSLRVIAHNAISNQDLCPRPGRLPAVDHSFTVFICPWNMDCNAADGNARNDALFGVSDEPGTSNYFSDLHLVRFF